jgi:hypothetical protein
MPGRWYIPTFSVETSTLDATAMFRIRAALVRLSVVVEELWVL